MRLYSILKIMAEKIKTLTPLWFTYSSYSFAVRIGNVLIQGGYNTIQPAAANTVTLKTITFPSPGYSIPPQALTTIIGAPTVATCRITVKERTTSSITVAIYASNTTNRGFCWFVIG